MTKVNTLKGNQVLVKVGDGATPTEAFAAPALINTTRSLQLTATTVDTAIPDKDNPDLPNYIEREKDTLSGTITGEGMLDKDDLPDWLAWFASPDSKNCEVYLGTGVGDQKVVGKFHLNDFQVSGEQRGKATVSITLSSDGVFTPEAIVA